MIGAHAIAACLLLAAGTAMTINPEHRSDAVLVDAADEQLASLSWLAGTWRSDEFEATYTTPHGGMILSASKFMQEGKAVYMDFERIQVIDGVVTLTPYPGGKESVPFKLTGYDAKVKKAVFRNPEHDFPTELRYELASQDNLVIHVAGMQEGKETVMKIDMRRVR